MFSKPSSWLAKAKYRYKLRQLVKPNARAPKHQLDRNMYKDLVRADREENRKARMQQKRTLDILNMPFELPRGPQDSRVYVLYEDFYCILPINPDESSTSKRGGEAVRAYSEWLTAATKGEHSEELQKLLTDPLKMNQTAVEQSDTLHALNNYLLNNKFQQEGWVLSSNLNSYTTTATESSDNLCMKSKNYLTVIYHRAYYDDAGMEIDPNIFTLMEAQHDFTTNMQIFSGYLPSDLKRLIAGALKGLDTNIMKSVPTDKALYASVTCLLKPDYSLTTIQ